MFCSVFVGEGEGWEVMVLFTDCPVVQTYRQKENKTTFGIKRYPNCLAITLVFALSVKDPLSPFHLTENAHAAVRPCGDFNFFI